MPSAIRRTMGPLEWAMLIALSLIWGGSFFFNAVALRGFPPLTIVALRVGVGAICLWMIVLAMRYPFPRDPALWLRFLAMGILNNAIPFTLIVWGQQHIASGLASILNATTPLFTVVVANILLVDEKLDPYRLFGVVAGFAGVAVMVGDTSGGWGQNVWAELAILSASLSYAFASVYGRRFANVPPMVTAAGQVTASSLVMVPLALWADRPWTFSAIGSDAWAAALSLAVVSTALAYTLYFSILKRSGATNIVLVTLLNAPTAILLGSLFLHETVTLTDLAGLLAIGAGLALIDGRPLRVLTALRRTERTEE
jgi:drug/metabolite transporter (DMT)-like permease